jgi:hypothetical protein
MSQSEEVLNIVRAVVAILGAVLVFHVAILLEAGYQAANPIYSIIEVFIGFGLIVVGLSKKPEKVLEIIADFLQDLLDRIF